MEYPSIGMVRLSPAVRVEVVGERDDPPCLRLDRGGEELFSLNGDEVLALVEALTGMEQLLDPAGGLAGDSGDLCEVDLGKFLWPAEKEGDDA